MSNAIAAAARLINNFDDLPVPVQMGIADMVFNMGQRAFSQFQNFIAAIENNDYETAAAEMENSAWFGQVGRRAADF
jgi:GH24 family phage-related lysozyme (muramidase)